MGKKSAVRKNDVAQRAVVEEKKIEKDLERTKAMDERIKQAWAFDDWLYDPNGFSDEDDYIDYNILNIHEFLDSLAEKLNQKGFFIILDGKIIRVYSNTDPGIQIKTIPFSHDTRGELKIGDSTIAYKIDDRIRGSQEAKLATATIDLICAS